MANRHQIYPLSIERIFVLVVLKMFHLHNNKVSAKRKNWKFGFLALCHYLRLTAMNDLKHHRKFRGFRDLTNQNRCYDSNDLASEADFLEAICRFAPASSFNTTCARDKLYYLMLDVDKPVDFATLLPAARLIGLSRNELAQTLQSYQRLFIQIDRDRNIWATRIYAESCGIESDASPHMPCDNSNSPSDTDRTQRPVKCGISCASIEELEAAAHHACSENEKAHTSLNDDELLYLFMKMLNHPAREKDILRIARNILGYSKADSSFRKAMRDPRYVSLCHGVKVITSWNHSD